MNREIKIADATDAQLRAFANGTLGFNLPANTKDTTVLARIKAAWDKDYILVAEESAAADGTQSGDAPPAPSAIKAATDERPEKVRIIINVTEETGGNDPVVVGVNGKVMLIPRGEEVEIPHPYFEVLKNAVTHKYEQLPDGGLNPVPREVSLYPFQRVA